MEGRIRPYCHANSSLLAAGARVPYWGMPQLAIQLTARDAGFDDAIKVLIINREDLVHMHEINGYASPGRID
jgi:hypothetical protein